MTRKLNRKKPRIFAAPEGKCLYVFGDVHGRAKSLKILFQEIEEDASKRGLRNDQIIIIGNGDYLDRGPDNYEVMEFLIDENNKKDGVTRKFNEGNHESYIRSLLEGGNGGVEAWLKHGGAETMEQYGASTVEEFRAKFPKTHKRFLDHLRTGIFLGDYFITHAGVRPGIALNKQSHSDLLSIRREFLDYAGEPFTKKIIHGHTKTKDFQPEIKNYRINIDTDANHPKGNLTCVVLQGTDVDFIQVSTEQAYPQAFTLADLQLV